MPCEPHQRTKRDVNNHLSSMSWITHWSLSQVDWSQALPKTKITIVLLCDRSTLCYKSFNCTEAVALADDTASLCSLTGGTHVTGIMPVTFLTCIDKILCIVANILFWRLVRCFHCSFAWVVALDLFMQFPVPDDWLLLQTQSHCWKHSCCGIPQGAMQMHHMCKLPTALTVQKLILMFQRRACELSNGNCPAGASKSHWWCGFC